MLQQSEQYGHFVCSMSHHLLFLNFEAYLHDFSVSRKLELVTDIGNDRLTEVTLGSVEHRTFHMQEQPDKSW